MRKIWGESLKFSFAVTILLKRRGFDEAGRLKEIKNEILHYRDARR